MDDRKRKLYMGARLFADPNIVLVAKDPHHTARLDPRKDLKECSLGGRLEWGARVAGALQLSLAILADYLENDDLALELYEQFCDDLIVKIRTEVWTMWGEDIHRWLARKGLG